MNNEITFRYFDKYGTTTREETYTLPFEMVVNDYYVCYIKEEYDPPDWDDAKMVVLRYQGIIGKPTYAPVEGEYQPAPGAGVVLPFKHIGCTYPPQHGEDRWLQT